MLARYTRRIAVPLGLYSVILSSHVSACLTSTVSCGRPVSLARYVIDADKFIAEEYYTVIPIPTREEMLDWAAEADRRIARGELPPLGGSSEDGFEEDTQAMGARPLSRDERQQLLRAADLLRERSQLADPLTTDEALKLSTSLGDVAAILQHDEASRKHMINHRLRSFELNGKDKVVEGTVHVSNSAYGSAEVRDKLYLYAWSMLHDKFKKKENGGGAVDET